MIVDLIDIPNSPWSVLPAGVHLASLTEVREKFATNPHRKKLFNGLVDAAEALSKAGCGYLYLDGSYITGKPRPGDYDGCWDPRGVDPSLLDPVLLEFDNARRNQKIKFLGELFPFSAEAAPGKTFMEFFQIDRFSGSPKGIVAIDLNKESFDLVRGVAS